MERDKLILDNLGLVRKEAFKYCKKMHCEYEDLFQEGCIGLIKAADMFDESKGFKFSTYAVTWIKGVILIYLRDHNSLIDYHRNFKKMYEIYSMESRVHGTENLLLKDLICDEMDIEETITDKIFSDECINSLTGRNKSIIELRLKGKTQKQIGKIVGLSQVGVHRCIKHIAENMRLEGISI